MRTNTVFLLAFLLLFGFFASTFPSAKATESSFGKTAVGLSTNFATTNYMQGCNFTAPEDGTVTQIVFYAADATTCNVKTVIVYLGNLTILDNGIGANVLVTSTAGWWVSTFSTPPAISGGESYVLMIVPETNLNYFYCDALAGASRIDTSNSYSSPTNPTDASVDVYAYSIYANYTATSSNLESFTHELNTPADDSTVGDYSCDFAYTPTLIGTDSFHNATLYLNGTSVASNSTVIENATSNAIRYVLPGQNATYLWGVQVWNSTHALFSTNGNFTLNVAVGSSTTTNDEEYFIIGGVIAGVLIGCGAFAVFYRREDDED